MSKSQSQQTSRAPVFIGIGLVLLLFVFFFFIVALFVSVTSSFSSDGASGRGNVALIRIDGPIMTQSQQNLFGSSGIVSSERVVKRLDSLARDSSIEAIMIEINSPGGSGVATDEIAQAIRAIDKPTVAYIREVGASGSYWVASSTDYVIANRMSTVGSIGVIASYLDFSGFIENYNVTYQRFVSGESKDFGSPFRSPTEQEQEQFQILLDQMHDIFVTEVAQNRNLSVEHVRELADGSIFSGLQASQNGLVDQLGGRAQAQEYLENRLNKRVSVVEYSDAPTFFDILFGYMRQPMTLTFFQSPVIFT
ncbi:MAG: signal peptide peptidase SppA [Candidatus Woesearchaeota archaeon]